MQALHEDDPGTVPHPLPDEYGLTDLITDLPLRLVQYVDMPDLYYAILQARTQGCISRRTWLQVGLLNVRVHWAPPV